MKEQLKQIVLGGVILSSLILTSCQSNSGKYTEEKASHSATEHNHNEETEGMAVLSAVQREAIDLQVDVMPSRAMTGVVKTSGQLEVSPSSKAEVTAYIGGNVVSIEAFQGDKVKKGQVLATLEHPDIIQLQQDFIQKYNNLEYLKQEFNRQKELYDKEVGSGKAFQKSKADYHSAKAQYQGLKLRLQMLKLDTKRIEQGNIIKQLDIVSPISGYVSGMNISLGSYIDARTQMFSIRNFDEIHADLSVFEKDIRKVEKGQTVRLKVANLPNIELKGEVFAIAKEYAPNSRSVVVHANINNPPQKLIADSYVSGEILTQSQQVSAVPESAVVTDGDKHFIFVFDEQGSLAANHNEEDHNHSDADGHNHEAEHNHSDADGHNHEAEHSHSEADGHNHEAEHNHFDADGHNHEAEHNHSDADGHNHEAEHNHSDADGHNHEAEHSHSDADGHNHEAEHNHSDADGHNHEAEHNHGDSKVFYASFKQKKVAYRMVEVFINDRSEGYVAITPLEKLSAQDLVVLKGAYYLLSDLKKSEAAHQH